MGIRNAGVSSALSFSKGSRTGGWQHKSRAISIVHPRGTLLPTRLAAKTLGIGLSLSGPHLERESFTIGVGPVMRGHVVSCDRFSNSPEARHGNAHRPREQTLSPTGGPSLSRCSCGHVLVR